MKQSNHTNHNRLIPGYFVVKCAKPRDLLFCDIHQLLQNDQKVQNDQFT